MTVNWNQSELQVRAFLGFSHRAFGSSTSGFWNFILDLKIPIKKDRSVYCQMEPNGKSPHHIFQMDIFKSQEIFNSCLLSRWIPKSTCEYMKAPVQQLGASSAADRYCSDLFSVSIIQGLQHRLKYMIYTIIYYAYINIYIYI